MTSPRPNILYLTHRMPYPPDKGDRIRGYNLLRWVSQRASVHLACLADEPVQDSSIAALEQYCERLAVVRLGSLTRWPRALGSLALGRTVTEGAFGAPALRTTLRQWARETQFHAAIASGSSMVGYLRMDELSAVPAVVDLQDVDSQKWLDYAETCSGPRGLLYRIEGHRLRRLELGLSEWARAVVLVSEREMQVYRQFGGSGARLVTSGVDLDTFQATSQKEEPNCVFVGALNYHPNVEGIRWFCHEVWPQLHEPHPQSRLLLVGRRPVPAVLRLARIPGVELIGQVPDVRPYMAGAAVAIAPLHIARGLQNKVIEALAMGKATVASPAALAGFSLEPGTHALAATTAREWVAAITRLLADPHLRSQLGSAGRRYVEENHCWDHCLAPFAELLGLAPGSVSPVGRVVLNANRSSVENQTLVGKAS